MFLFFQETRNRRAQSMSKSVMHGSPYIAAKSWNCRKNKRYLQSVGSRKFRAAASATNLSSMVTSFNVVQPSSGV